MFKSLLESTTDEDLKFKGLHIPSTVQFLSDTTYLEASDPNVLCNAITDVYEKGVAAGNMCICGGNEGLCGNCVFSNYNTGLRGKYFMWLKRHAEDEPIDVIARQTNNNAIEIKCTAYISTKEEL